MKPSEAAVILTKIAAYDRRTVGESDAAAWAEALDGMVTLEDALTAVRDHFRESTDWMMPKHIIDRSQKLRFKRISEAGEPDFPPDMTPAQEREWLTHFYRQLAYSGNVCSAQGYADEKAGVTRIPSVPVDPDHARKVIDEFARNYALDDRLREHVAWQIESGTATGIVQRAIGADADGIVAAFLLQTHTADAPGDWS